MVAPTYENYDPLPLDLELAQAAGSLLSLFFGAESGQIFVIVYNKAENHCAAHAILPELIEVVYLVGDYVRPFLTDL